MTTISSPLVDRRNALRLGGTLAAAGALATAAPAVHAAENNTIKLALVGCGGRGTGAVVNAFATTAGPVKLVAMADVFANRLESSYNGLARQAAKNVDVPPERRFVAFDGFKQAIDCLGQGDVVILATPAVFRPIHFEYAVQKGVNVFMEKSFAVDAPQVRRLMQASAESEKKNLKVGVGFMWRHSQARQEVIQRIHDGAIGDVHTLRIYRVHGPHHCGKFAGGNEMEFQLRKFMSFNWASGGFFVDWHCHNVDVACWAKNAWPVSAQGMGGRTYPEAGNLFDQYTVEFTFADGAKLFAFSRHMARCWSTYADYAHGSKGSAVLMANLTQPQTRIYKSQNMIDSEIAWRYTGKEESPYVREWQVLLEAIRENKPHNESRRGAEADLTAIMGRMAAHSGQLVTWDEALKSEFQYVPNVEQLTLDSTPPIKAGADGFYPVPIPGITREY